MRYEIAFALLSVTLLGAVWALRRHRLAPATSLALPQSPVGAIRRRPF